MGMDDRRIVEYTVLDNMRRESARTGTPIELIAKWRRRDCEFGQHRIMSVVDDDSEPQCAHCAHCGARWRDRT